MNKIVISLLVCSFVAFSTSSFSRDKQPRRFNVDENSEQGVTSAVVQSTNQPKMSVDDRLARLERLVNSQGLVDLLLKIEELQKEVQQLRGDVETQTYIANDLKKRQRDLYVDIDRRLLQIERKGSGRIGYTDNPSKGIRNTFGNTDNLKPATPSSSQVIAPEATQTGSGSIQQTKPVGKKVAAVSVKPIDPIKEQNAYQKAFDLLRELRYEQAIKAYRQFIRDYPNGRYAHIAQYWLSEASYAQRHFKQAIQDYKDLLNNYPNSPKLAEAMLKIGYSYNALGQNNEAKDIIEKLLRVYPNTTAASQGQNLLKKIKSTK